MYLVILKFKDMFDRNDGVVEKFDSIDQLKIFKQIFKQKIHHL